MFLNESVTAVHFLVVRCSSVTVFVAALSACPFFRYSSMHPHPTPKPTCSLTYYKTAIPGIIYDVERTRRTTYVYEAALSHSSL